MAIFLNDNIFNTWNLSGVPDQVRLGILEGMNCGRYPKNTDRQRSHRMSLGQIP